MLSGEFQKGMNKMPYYYYWDWTYLLIIPGLILGLIAQAKVKSAYAQCSRIPAKCGLTASQMRICSAATATPACASDMCPAN